MVRLSGEAGHSTPSLLPSLPTVLPSTVPYSRKYWRGIIFGGLADFLSHRQY